MPRRKLKEETKPIYQNLTGLKAQIIGDNDLEPTEGLYGVGDEMFDRIGDIGIIKEMILETEEALDDNGEPYIIDTYAEGVIMLGYSWSLEDIKILPPDEKIKSKIVTFDPKKLFEGLNKDGHKHKRISDGDSSKRRSKTKQSGSSKNKTVAKRSVKRDLKVRKR